VSESFVLPAAHDRTDAIGKLMRHLYQLPTHHKWRVVVEPFAKQRSLSQNATLWGVVYPQILEQGGESLAGFTGEELHDFFLIEHFGSETSELFGRKKLRPLRRSSKLTTSEFADFLEHICRFMAERGIVIEMPGDTFAGGG
jgi:hypothetical protein